MDADLKAAATISIHSPRMGRDAKMDELLTAAKFQSTLPAWGETCWRCWTCPGKSDFNPLSPHGERQGEGVRPRATGDFNPLSPHGERRTRKTGCP